MDVAQGIYYKYTNEQLYLLTYYHKIKIYILIPSMSASVPTRSTVWPSPARISSSSSAQPAAAPPRGYWCSAPPVRSLLSEQKQDVNNAEINRQESSGCRSFPCFITGLSACTEASLSNSPLFVFFLLRRVCDEYLNTVKEEQTLDNEF